MRVIQSLIVHDVLVRRKASLDQIRKGLQTSGVLGILRQNYHLAENLFLSSTTNEVSAKNFLECIIFDTSNSQHRCVFSDAIKEMSEEELSKLYIFITGSTDYVADLSISLTFKDAPSVFVSTCTYELIIPISATSSVSFLKNTLIAASQSGDKSFNTM